MVLVTYISHFFLILRLFFIFMVAQVVRAQQLADMYHHNINTVPGIGLAVLSLFVWSRSSYRLSYISNAKFQLHILKGNAVILLQKIT
jgi:hypothetical protein